MPNPARAFQIVKRDPRGVAMPHHRAHSWAGTEQKVANAYAERVGAYAGTTGRKGGAYDASTEYDPYMKGRDAARLASGRSSRYDRNPPGRMRAIVAITDPAGYLPLPYVQSTKGLETVNEKEVAPGRQSPGPEQPSLEGEKRTWSGSRLSVPAPLSLFPSLQLPGSTYNPRNELLRRASPTTSSFGSPTLSIGSPTFSTFSSTPPLTPNTPITPASTQSQQFSTTTVRDGYQSPKFEAQKEPVYVLTLRTSEGIDRQMQSLRRKWFPANRLKVPAHITLFHALPESRLPSITKLVEELTQTTSAFEISTGKVIRMKAGVLVHMGEGENETKRIFNSLRSNCWEFLSEQDKSFKAHWTVQNKEKDQERVEEAYKETHNTGAGMGSATGLVLWKYENDGRWTKQKEFGFAEKSSSNTSSPASSQGDGWPTY